MLRSLNSLLSYQIHATDGDLGAVNDFYFDDESWTIRYLVVDTGRWLPGRKVLLTPDTIGQPAWAAASVPVNLTREQIKSSPDIDTDKPVSRQRQIELHRHYGWPFYWTGGGVWPDPVTPVPPPATVEPTGLETHRESGDPHLRSLCDLTGYHIQATDGSIGHVEDLVADDETWEIRYLVVDTRNWLPGRKVLIAPQWFVGPISWSNRTVTVYMTQESIRNSPQYDPKAPINREYEGQLHDYYGRPGYWR